MAAPPAPPCSAFGSLTQFRDAQRMAAMLARSSIVPENFRGDENLGNCVIALELANRIGVSILVVMQNLQQIHGKAAWSSQFLISCVNASKRFSPLRYQMTGTPGEDSRGCIAWAHDKTGELLQSPEVTIRMAREAGWYYRPGSGWKILPELMLRYRSATWFTRLYAPEITMGIQTTEEVIEMSAEGNPSVTRPDFKVESAQRKLKPRFSPETRGELPTEPKAPPISVAATAGVVPAPESATLSNALTTTLRTDEPKAAPGHYHYLKALNGLIGLSLHTEADVLTYLRQRGRCNSSLVSLAEVAGQHPDVIVWTHDHWNLVEQELTQLGKGPRS